MRGAWTAAAVAGLVLGLAAPPAGAVVKVFKYDQFAEDLSTAASQMTGMTLAGLAGMTQGEAFGQVYRPAPEEYPIQILGVDLVLNAWEGAQVDAQIEIWNSDATGANPGGSEPLWSVHTSALSAGGGQFGMPLQDGALQIDFDWSDPTKTDNHPPMILSGNIWVMVRYTDPAVSGSFSGIWANCNMAPCGCEPVVGILDQQGQKSVNVMHYFSPTDLLNPCSNPSFQWAFFEGLGVQGDVVMRMRADVAAAACEPDCAGKSCGDDGCGGVCGVCGAGEGCQDGQCVTCVPDCAGKECGPDGCGTFCGVCAQDELCVQGTCEAAGPGACDPPCGAGERCVDGACEAALACDPPCGAGQACNDGTCVPTASGEVFVTDISPSFGLNDQYTAVSVTGSGFAPGAVVKLGATELVDVKVTGDALLDAKVPPDMEPGTYSVIVVNPDNQVGTLKDGFEVRAAQTECGVNECRQEDGTCGVCTVDGGAASGGCGAAPSGAGAALGWLALVGLGLWVGARRRRGARS